MEACRGACSNLERMEVHKNPTPALEGELHPEETRRKATHTQQQHPREQAKRKPNHWKGMSREFWLNQIQQKEGSLALSDTFITALRLGGCWL
ncbi:hypothetical protein VIGAN_UM116000 [Vigna angularis var. angularis]|uniref:Uncharacterized protein n=1 Tax=Vigna angularis var. angularis TaxID=157739 RepID=A0A0S3TER8_PHAAN|nr:hypothetical protein VIGAN_UM116000 [Vigna angularis var. angularis]